MASGKVHAAISLATLATLPVVALWQQWPVPVGALAVGLGIGLFVTPDLDLPGRTHEERRRFIGPILRVVFWPYARKGKHRDWRHWPLIGTLARACYLGLPFWLAMVLLGASVPSVPLAWLGWAFAGWCVQDGLHWVADWPIWKGRI